MTKIKLTKELPRSLNYTGSGVTVINLKAIELLVNTKKTLIKAHLLQNPGDSVGDEPTNEILDLQHIDDTMVIRFVLDDELRDSGTATSGTINTLEDTSKSWTGEEYKGYTILITSGTGKGQKRVITTNDSTTATISVNWDTNPDTTSTYEIVESAWNQAWKLRAMSSSNSELSSLVIGEDDDPSPPRLVFDGSIEEILEDSGTATSSTSLTLTDTSKSWTENKYFEYKLSIVSGTGSGQDKTITENTSDTLTIDSAWAVNPSTDSVYEIIELREKYRAFLEEVNLSIKADSTGPITQSFGIKPVRITGSIAIYFGSNLFD